MSQPLWHWSAADLAQAIRDKHLTSQEVIEAHLQRIDAVNGQVNAVTLVLRDSALKAAQAADRKVRAGEALGPLHGVPITIKENIDVAGSATTHGIVKYKDNIAQQDAAVIAHLRQAGAIPIARTNTPDFGLRWHTDNALHGATLNPWDPLLTPGGSSGGEAAAIAAGMSPLGIGNDMGGSVRQPAQCCGITGLRPSLGRVSRISTAMFGDSPYFYEQMAAVNGPMARHIKDLRLALEVMSQPDPNDPIWQAMPSLTQPRTEPIRVAVTTDPLGAGCDPDVAAAVKTAAASLERAGYEIEECTPPSLEASEETIQQIVDIEFKSFLQDMLDVVSEDAKTVLLNGLVGDTEPDVSIYMDAIARRHQIARDWSLFLDRYPLVLGPVSTLQAAPVGFDLRGPEAFQQLVASLALTEVCNLIGLPSVTLPVEVSDGLPQGVLLIAARSQDALCLEAAEAIEARQGVFTPIEPRSARDAG